MPRDQQIIDLSNPAQKRMVLGHVKAATGLHWFVLTRCRAQRSLAQNAYLWAVVYPVLAAGMTEAWGETISVEQCHELMKGRFLSTPVVNRNTGEQVGTLTRSTTELDRKEFAEYIDKLIKLGAEYLGVNVPPPTPNVDGWESSAPHEITAPGSSNDDRGAYTGHTPSPADVGGPVKNIWPALS